MNGQNSPYAGLSELTSKIGYEFRDVSLLETAVTHPSAPRDTGMPDYQRLEFLGDAVLELCASRALFDRYTDAREGELTTKRIKIVQEAALTIAAQKLGLSDYIRMSPGDRKCEAHMKPSVVSDVYEAILGAIYLDGGLREADAFARRTLSDYDPDNPAFDMNWKSQLQELIQAQGGDTPVYHLVGKKGPPHAPIFSSVVQFGSSVMGRGNGTSKKDAEQRAARNALGKIYHDKEREYISNQSRSCGCADAPHYPQEDAATFETQEA